MSEPMPIPEEVQRFLLRNIDSVSELEGLLLLRREHDRGWKPAALAQRLYIREPEGEAILLSLYRRGLLRQDGGEGGEYWYAPADEELRQLADQVAQLYTTHLIPITHLIHSKPNRAVQSFADAFRFREKK